jgi:hypothetical protein
MSAERLNATMHVTSSTREHIKQRVVTGSPLPVFILIFLVIIKGFRMPAMNRISISATKRTAIATHPSKFFTPLIS